MELTKEMAKKLVEESVDGVVTIPEGVTEIGEEAFRGCSSLTKITIPEGVTEIGTAAFFYCRSLTEINLPEGVTEIGDEAFSGCRSLTEINLPEGVTEIGEEAFRDCSSLTKITIPEGVTKLGNNAFSYCSSLTEINLPEGVTEIGDEAFSNCRSLTEINLLEGVTEIGDGTFWDCISLTKITIPEGVTKIGNSAFYGCSSLTKIKIPEGVTEIGNIAFSYCSSLTEMNLPEGVTEIGYKAFKDCKSLTKINVPKGVTEIGEEAFESCRSLTEINLPEGVTGIGDEAFIGCSSLTKITIPEGVTEIGNNAFRNCSSLTKIKIPKGVTEIGKGVFWCCRSLTEINLPEGVTEIGEEAFRSCISLTKIKIPEGVTEIGKWTFWGCSSLTEINLPKGVTEIGYNAFSYCSSLTEITIPKGVTEIEMTTFEGCSSLTEINIPEGVTSIGGSAFSDCVCLRPENVHIEYEEEIKELLESSVLILDETMDIDEYIHKKYKEKDLVKKIVDIIGYDETKELISCPKNISEEEYEKLGKEYQERFKEVYEKRYEVKGESRAVIGFLEEVNSFHKFRNVEDSFLVIFNQEMETSSNLNEALENTCRKLEEKGKKINLTEEKKNSIRKNMYEEIWKSRKEEIEKIVKEKLRNEEIGHPQIIRDYLIKAISRTMKEEGGIEEAKEELRKILDNLTEAHQEIVEENKEGKIDKILEEIYKENEKLLRVNYLEIIKKYKERIEKGWIFKSLKVSKKGLENLELGDIKFLEIPNEEYEEYYKVKDEKKAGELLRDAKFSKLMTFEKAELMFNAIRPINIEDNENEEYDEIQPEYSKDFIEFFLSHKEKILENLEYYERFSEMHNKFESLKERTDFLRHLKNGTLTIDMVIRACNKIKHENVKEGNEELDDIMQMGDQKAFDVAQEVYEITKKRESTTIPYIEEKSSKFRARMLRPDEPAQLGVGYNTTCCQQPGGWGESSMLHSALSRNGRVFVIEEWNEERKRYEIIGQSWVWREKDRICFDNIEIQNQVIDSMSKEEKQEILDIYKEVSKKLLEKDKKIMTKLRDEGKITQEQFEILVLKDVTTGIGCSDLEDEIQENLKKDVEGIQVDSKEYFEKGYDKFAYGENKDELYTDASVQYVLAESEEYKRDIETKGKEAGISVEYLKERQIKELKGDQIKSNIIREIKRIKSNNLGIEDENLDIDEFYYENDIDYKKAEVAISYDSEWYMLYEEREKEIYLASSMIDKKIEANKENRLNEGMIQLELKLKMLEIIERGMLKGKKLEIYRQENEEVISMIEELRKEEIINDIQTIEDMTTIGIDREKVTEDEYQEKIEKIKKEKEKVIEELQKQYETREEETMIIKDIKGEEERE